MTKRRTSSARLWPWLLSLVLVGGVISLSLLIRDNASAEISAAPVYTAVPDGGVKPEGANGAAPTPAPAQPAAPLTTTDRRLFSWVAPIEFAPDAPLAAPTLSYIFLPFTAQSYAPPPRAVEPFAPVSLPAVDWPANAPTMSASKLGLHALGPSDPALVEFIRRAKPRVVKSVGSFGWLTEVKQISPGTVTLGRPAGEDTSLVGVDPAAAAQTYINQNLDQYRLNPGVDYWEGWNEFIPADASQLKWYAQFEAERACQMRALGYHAAVGGFAVGWPLTYADMGLFLPALEAAHRCGGMLTVHEYNRPLMMCGVRSGQPNVIPGAPPLLVPAGPLTFRYRFWYEGYLKPRGWGDLPLVISEYGFDAVPAINCPDPGPGTGSWKSLGDWWRAQGYNPEAPSAFVDQLAWADREMQHDPYLIGATVFTGGAVDPSSGWSGFDLHDVYVPLAQYMVTVH